MRRIQVRETSIIILERHEWLVWCCTARRGTPVLGKSARVQRQTGRCGAAIVGGPDVLGRCCLEVATSDPICGGERVESVLSDRLCGEERVGSYAAEA